MTAALCVALGVGAVALVVSVVLKRADDRRCDFANLTDGDA